MTLFWESKIFDSSNIESGDGGSNSEHDSEARLDSLLLNDSKIMKEASEHDQQRR